MYQTLSFIKDYKTKGLRTNNHKSLIFYQTNNVISFVFLLLWCGVHVALNQQHVSLWPRKTDDTGSTLSDCVNAAEFTDDQGLESQQSSAKLDSVTWNILKGLVLPCLMYDHYHLDIGFVSQTNGILMFWISLWINRSQINWRLDISWCVIVGG